MQLDDGCGNEQANPEAVDIIAGDESGFTVERRTGSGGYVQVARVGPNATSYTDGGLARRTTYTYRVRAYNTAGDSAYSNEASGTTK